MKRIARFHADGRVLDTTLVDDEITIAGYETVPMELTPFSHIKVGDSVVELSDEEQQRLRSWAPGLTPGFEWDPVTRQWVDARTLAAYKDGRVSAIRIEALARIQVELPGLDSYAAVQLMRELWLSIAPAARQPTAKLAKVIQIHQAAATASASVEGAGSRAAVDAVTVAWP